LLNGVDASALAEPVRQTGEQAKAILAELRKEVRPIHLTSTLAFNMTGGSLCLGFAPDTEEDCAALMGMHARFQEVVALNYPLTPHVTLAYFKPGTYGEEAVAQLAELLKEINALPKVHITVDAACLHYYRFEDMNTYIRG
jgi:2'-5' RNA ligase